MAATPGSRRVEHVMGMPVIVDLRDDGVDGGVLDRVFAWFRSVDERFSTFRGDSEISRVSRGELDPADAHPEVREVLRRCEEVRVETDGYFDVRAASPGAIDPSGYVKGWSVDRAAALLEDAGARNFAISAGGDVVVRGGALPEPFWRIGVQHPRRRDAVARAVEAIDTAIATSGAYERGDHIVDPSTGRPPRGVLSVTVVGPELGTSDAYATAAFAMGPPGARWAARLRGGYEAMTILDDDTVLSTPGFPDAV